MTERNHHHQQQHQRRPPDVEEALSSMLWTPYERTPTDSSSSDDDDEKLNSRLRKSQSNYDNATIVAAAVPNFVSMPTSYFDCDDYLLPATAGSTSTTIAATGTATVASFVPFSNIIISNNRQQQHFQQQQQQHHQNLLSSARFASSNYHYKDYDPAAKGNYRFSYPYYGPIPSLNKWWSSSLTTHSGAIVEPPSYESLYAKNAMTHISRPALKSLKASVATLSNGVVAASKIEAEDRQSAVAVESGGRMVHSFTDDFIAAENCKPSPALPINALHGNNFHNPHTRLLQGRKQQQQQQSILTSTNTTCCDQLPLVNNVNSEMSKGQVNENFTDVTSIQQQTHMHQINTKHKQNDYSNSNYMLNVDIESHQQEQQQHQRQYVSSDDENDNNKSKNTQANVKQVNQPVSVALCAKRPTNTSISSEMNSTIPIVTIAAAEMNSPMNFTTSDKTTKTTLNNNNSSSSSSLKENTSNARNIEHTVKQQQKTAISSSRVFRECGPSALVSVEKLSPVSARSKCAVARAQLNLISQELTTNKCFAELERLRAEFRASESKRALNASSRKMRVNIPATVAVATTNVAMKVVPMTAATTTSSVFLTATSSGDSSNNNNVSSNSCNNNIVSNINSNSTVSILTTTNGANANPCQRQPSLTIQVNNNNPNNGNTLAITPTVFPTQFDCFVNPTIVNNNGISVVNCNYVQNESSSGVSVNNNSSSNSSSSVPNVFNSNKSANNASILNCVNNNRNKSNVAASVAAITSTTTTTTIANESVNIINVNSNVDSLYRPTAVAATIATTPQSPVIAVSTLANLNSASTSSSGSASTSPNSSANSSPTNSPSRTFTSTECQTDDISTVQLRAKSHPQPLNSQYPISTSAHLTPASVISTREQRRRERRERRHHQQQLQQLQHGPPPPLPPHPHHGRRQSDRRSLPAPPPPHPHLHPSHALHHALAVAASVPPNATMPAAMSTMLRPMLPDILHSHFPPPYSALGGGPPGIPPPPPPSSPPPPPPPPLRAAGAVGPNLLSSVISTVPMPGATTIAGDGRFTIPLPIIRRSPSERSGKGCCGQWFAGPPLRALIAVVALGGVACALGGAALGATGLAGPPSSHFTAALLMIGVGVVLVTVSGAAWRMTAPGGPPCLGLGSSVDLGRCGRRPCSRGGGAPHGLLYPEFQHRPPPPSYQASMQEYRLRLLLLDRDRQNGVVRGNSPPPTYRSHAGSLLRAPLTTTIRGIGSIGGNGGGSSSIGGSEYSLPPSYRSRNATPAIICSERSIETAPSGRLLANEDIPEPLSAEQVSEYSSLQHLRQVSDLSLQQTPKSTTTTTIGTLTTAATTMTTATPAANQLRTSAIVEIETKTATTTNRNITRVTNDKLQAASRFKDELSSASICSGNTKSKDLVTIVTVSQNHSDMLLANNLENRETQQQQQQQRANEQMEILAHL